MLVRRQIPPPPLRGTPTLSSESELALDTSTGEDREDDTFKEKKKDKKDRKKEKNTKEKGTSDPRGHT